MKEFRNSKGVSEHYTSLAELREGFGLKPFVKRTKDKAKLEKQQEQFCNRNRCKACNQPMTYVGGSVMTCKNEACKGIPVEKTDNDGNVTITYLVSYRLLDDKSAEIANNIFGF